MLEIHYLQRKQEIFGKPPAETMPTRDAVSIADLLEEEVCVIEDLIKLIKSNSGKTDTEIASIYLSSKEI